MESSDAARRHHVNENLESSREAREKLAQRLAAPWWYKLGAALSTLAIFIGVGLLEGDPLLGGHEPAGNLMIVLGAIVGPVVLLFALKNTTGVSVNRYAQGLGWWYAAVFGLLVAAFVLQVYAGTPLALPIAGAIAFAATLIAENHIDTTLRHRIANPAREGQAGD